LNKTRFDTDCGESKKDYAPNNKKQKKGALCTMKITTIPKEKCRVA